MILGKVRDPRLITIRRGGTLTITVWRSGRPTAPTTSSTTSRAFGRTTTARVGRSHWHAPGRAARSP
jgi:hypothetical protein